MIVEVVAVGTELLLGQIVNGNGAWIGDALAESGLDAHHQQVVGDNLGRLEAALRLAMSRADAVIITGGIGPTQDDLTREGICAATGRPMAFSEDYAQFLRDRFAQWGRDMPESNYRQAEHPEGATLLPNPKGTAPGLVLEHDGTFLFALPGVPEEMHLLMTDHVLPRLREAAGVDRVIVNRIVRSWGKGEASIGELLDDLFSASSNPSIAFLASAGEIKIRITAGAGTAAEAESLIEPVEAEVKRRLGSLVFGIDDDTIETVLIRMLQERGWTIGTAESATGGLVAARITAVPGASTVFRGGAVTYDVEEKRALLGVGEDAIAAGVVSETMARAMAQGARSRLGVDVAVAVTGAAGPDPHDGVDPGTMIIGVSTPEDTRARTLKFPGDRERVRAYTTTSSLHLVRLALTGTWWRP